MAELTKKEWALRIASWGVPVFPLWGVKDGVDLRTGQPASHAEGSGKKPKTGGADWRTYAETDPDAVARWFDSDPDINYGCVLGNGWMVVDCDSSDAVTRFEENYVNTEDAECDTMFVITGQGGHYWFRGDSRTFKFDQDMDLKAEGGYVVGPGSTSWSGAEYRVTKEDARVLAAPGWLGQRSSTKEHLPADEWEYFVAEAGGRNNALAKLAGHLIAMGLNPAVVEATLRSVNETSFDEPLSEDELVGTVLKTTERWAPGTRLADELVAERMFSGNEERFFMRNVDRRNKRSPRWAIDGVIPEWGVCQLYGPSYTGKSFVAIDLALRFANGMDWMDWRHNSPDRRHVLYIMAEGSWDFQQRVQAWCDRYDGTDANLITVEEKGLDLSSVEGWTKLMTNAEEDDDVREIWDRIGLVVLDTQSLLLWAEENSNSEMNRAFFTLKMASKSLNAPLMLIHHSVGEDAHRARGATAIFGACDTVIRLQTEPNGIDKCLRVEKVKAGPLPDTRAVFEIKASGKSAIVQELRIRPADESPWTPFLDLLETALEDVDPQRGLKAADVWTTLGVDWTDEHKDGFRAAAEKDQRFRVWRRTSAAGNDYGPVLYSLT